MASSKTLQAFLEPSDHIDWQHPVIVEKAASLTANCESELDKTRACFEFVRDCIQHSSDFRRNPVTCKASEVLLNTTGYCYAKSHLLAALLRACHIPAALCYQRLTIDGDKPPFCLHGLNAVYLQEHGWYRLDARGNKPGVSAEFSPPQEQLAFPLSHAGEADLPGRYASPLPQVVAFLEHCTSWEAVLELLPDMEAQISNIP